MGEHLPVNVTRKITYNNGTDSWLENSYIAIVQMGKKKKVIGKIEDIELDDKSFEITMELSAAGELTLAVNGEESTTL